MEYKVERAIYNPKAPGLIQITVTKTPSQNPEAPPEAVDVKVYGEYMNFINPMDVMLALDVCKGQVIQMMVEQQEAIMRENPNLQKFPWSKGGK